MLFSQRENFPNPARAFSPPEVRTVLARRLSRVRFAWFLLGTAVGAAASYYISSLSHHDTSYSRQLDMSRAVAALDARLAPLPAIKAPSEARNGSDAAVAIALTAFSHVSDPAKQGTMLPASYTMVVHRGDTLTSLLMDKGVTHAEADDIARTVKHIYNPRDLVAGKSLELHLDKSSGNPELPVVASLSINASPLKTISLTRNEDNSFSTREIKSPIFKSVARAGGEIHSSFYQTGAEAGIPPQMLAEIISAFSYDVDFQRDIREGDSIDVVFERMHTDKNVTTGYGKILYASLVLGDDEYTVYRHASPDGFAGYYNARGESVRKALLKTPINGARITSGFGMRVHPLLGYSKMHKGIDFGAAVGTPIYAAGDGVIEEAGRKGGYGNYVRIRHSDRYSTAYGHASRIARGIHSGTHVKQGQVIAYVGSTGFSTGPHLHYEILVGGAQVNPSGVKFRTGQTLAGHEMSEFKKQVQQVQVALETLPRNRQVASLEPQ